MATSYQQLLAHLSDVNNLNMAGSVLAYDQQTQMPRGGVEARASQLGTLARLSHELFTSEKTAQLLEAAESELNGADPDSDEASLIRTAKEDYRNATRLPAEFVAEYSELTSLGHEVWVEARQNNDFQHFLPTLEKLVEMARRTADYRGYEAHPYDALLDQYDRGMTSAQVKTIFDAHRPALVELVSAILEQQDRVDSSVLYQHFPADKQKEFGLMVAKSYGFDFHRGGEGTVVHPFCIHFSINDVRITTRYDENYVSTSLFGLMHEAGHGMYEQGVDQKYEGTPLASGTSLSVHESQSRMWENLVGRSKAFWSWAFPKLKQTFPDQLRHTDLDGFYGAINQVRPSLIRVEADEATYNLHIMLRFDLEMQLIEGSLKPADLPEAWNARFESDLGLTPPNDTQGVLQDVHWSAGLMGYFSTYALGNLLASQYYVEALKAHPSLPDEFAAGKFDTLLSWLQNNIHRYGRKYTTNELTQRITGEGINPAPYLHYLQSKYSEIYGL